jgi:hypothetical protein
MFDAEASGWRAAARSILSQRFQHDFAYCRAGLLRERTRRMGALGVTDMDLIFQMTAPADDFGTYVLCRALRRNSRRGAGDGVGTAG